MSITGCAVRINKEVIIQKIRYRIISFVLIVTFLLMAAIPASASESSQFVDIYSFGGISSSSNGSISDQWRFSVVDDTTINITLPANQTPVFYVDFLVYGSSGDVTFFIGSNQLNVVSFGYGLFRVFGDITYWNSNDLLPLRIVKSGTSWFNIVSAKVSYFRFSPFSLYPSCYINYPGGTHSWVDPGADGETGFSFYNSTQGDFQFWLTYDEWQAFDVITLDFVCIVGSINSITVTSESQMFPFTVSYLDNGNTYPGANYIGHIEIDLTGSYRVDEPLEVCISGALYGQESYLVRNVATFGYVKQSVVDPQLTWIQRIFNSIESWGQKIVDAILGESDSPPDTSVSDGLLESGQQIQDFETEHQEVINDNSDAITDVLDLTGFAPALALISDYAGGVFNLLGPYQQVLLMPISIGMILFVCSRVPGNMSGRVSRVSSRSIDSKTKEI